MNNLAEGDQSSSLPRSLHHLAGYTDTDDQQRQTDTRRFAVQLVSDARGLRIILPPPRQAR